MPNLNNHVRISSIDACFMALSTLHDARLAGRARLHAAIAILENASCASTASIHEYRAASIARESAARLRRLARQPPARAFEEELQKFEAYKANNGANTHLGRSA